VVLDGGKVPKARTEVELAVRLGNRPGALGKVLSTVADAGTNILAYCCYSDRDEGVVLLVTENSLRAKDALEAAGFHCRANTVVVVGATDQVGGAALLGARLGFAGVHILYSYASSADAEHFCAVFKTSDDRRAIAVLDPVAARKVA
jgi:hypothetical protein